MRFPVYSFLLLFLLIGPVALAQHSLHGLVREASGKPVPGCEVQVLGRPQTYQTDSTGSFQVPNLPLGPQRLRFVSLNHTPLEVTATVTGRAEAVDFRLRRRDQTLDEVVVAAPQSTFGQTRLREVEGTAIFAAKKSEVIVPDKLVANLATNNARQIYARVPGLNIWESDGGLQLNIGGRGLDPSRTGSFNTRQNGYDISADALGYPESYYTPPTEAVQRIQLVRGAASLQYGTQFGGLLNFELRAPVTDRKIALTSRQSVGSFGFFNSFNSLSGTVGKLSYYTFAQYKRADGWRPNSQFESKNFYADLRYQATERLRVGLQYAHLGYLAQQPGGLNDVLFARDARQSNRARNWFDVDWNLFNLNADWKLTDRAQVNLTSFGLLAQRQSLGYRPNRVDSDDSDDQARDLIAGQFRNWGLEARYLNRYQALGHNGVLLVGTRFYSGFNHSKQGAGPKGRAADFSFVDESLVNYDYRFPNRNVALFAENIFYLNDKWSVTPGLRYEYIRTKADGLYGNLATDLAGNITVSPPSYEVRVKARDFLLGGLGVSFKPSEKLEAYANFSQNYRSITFSDMRISNPSSVIDPNLQDEKGFTADLGLRGEAHGLLTYDLSAFALNYGNRIGEFQTYNDADQVIRERTNVGRALILGLETYAELELTRLRRPEPGRLQWSVFGNLGLIRGRYVQSDLPGVQGKQVEFVPAVNLKTGTRAGYGPFRSSLQFTYLSQQFTDATNVAEGGFSAVVGPIPAYQLLDLSLSWERRWLKLEGSINNLTDTRYFTRRATGYPGPGIIPSDGRAYFLTAQVKI